MRIPQNPEGDRTSPSSSSPQYVIPESEIIAFVNSLRVHHIPTVTLRLATIAYIIVQIMQNRLDCVSSETNLLLIKQIAQSYKNKHYRHFTDALVVALEPDKERFDSALITIAHALELLHGGSSLYLAARQFYEELLIAIKDEEDEK